jgi:hypothetical protein
VTTEQSANDSADFIDAARWLLEWHNRRSEAFTTRAVALLGFVGVVLALILQGADLKDVDGTAWTRWFLLLAVVALLVAALFALLTISSKPVAVPSVAQLRHWWGRHVQEPVKGSSGPLIAESLLNSSKITEVSAVSAAMEEADKRADRFQIAIWAMLVALVMLSALTLNILQHLWKG